MRVIKCPNCGKPLGGSMHKISLGVWHCPHCHNYFWLNGSQWHIFDWKKTKYKPFRTIKEKVLFT